MVQVRIKKDRAKINICDPGCREKLFGEPDKFRYVEKFDVFIRIHSRQEVPALGKEYYVRLFDLDSGDW